MIMSYALLAAFIWLGLETDWLRVRLPYGVGSKWHDELPYEVGYTDNEFMNDEDFPYCEIDMIWQTTDVDYQSWMRQRYSITYKLGVVVDPVVDYPQYKYLADNERIDQRRAGEMIYQRGTVRVRS